MALTDDDVREILRIIDESAVDELQIETEGFSLHVSKGAGADAHSGVAATPRAAPERASAPAASASAAASVGARGTAGAPTAEAGADDGLVFVPSPMLGTFYRAESPGAAAFVEVGARVEPDTTVCIIEVMKMMNSVPAGVSGVVAEICAENGQLVEYGEPLFRVTA
jgi:acetyl-CoA carboxylase biotin carboxyl carrier protein